jgi:hypothetical protein
VPAGLRTSVGWMRDPALLAPVENDVFGANCSGQCVMLFAPFPNRKVHNSGNHSALTPIAQNLRNRASSHYTIDPV